jgi:lincosamide nucleotidyltransferase A/C/D/E
MLAAHDVVALCRLLEEHHIGYWVMGGWGVDALLHRETRPHKDLDLLVTLDTLLLLWKMFDERGFTLQYVWEENGWIDRESERWPTAFVVADAQGRELDIHVIDFGPDRSLIQLYTHYWPFPESITDQGIIAGATVTCVSKLTQLRMHTGYTLPEGQLRDLMLLQAD